jgi:hypothetical protein
MSWHSRHSDDFSLLFTIYHRNSARRQSKHASGILSDVYVILLCVKCMLPFMRDRLRLTFVKQKKNTFWPMVGGIPDGLVNYVAILRAVQDKRPSRPQLVRLVANNYELKDSYARNIVDLLLIGAGLVESDGNRCLLTPVGLELAKSGSAALLYNTISRNFIGIDELTDLIEQCQPISGEAPLQTWVKTMRKVHSLRWNASHARMQFKHRIEWLRAIGFVNKVADEYYLSKMGMQ